MDKYLIRKPVKKESYDNYETNSREKRLKQTTIQSLARVVNIDELISIKKVLDNPNDNHTQVIIDSLKKLQNVRPSKEVLMSVKVGHSVNKLRKHQNSEVKHLAITVLKDWKQFYKELRSRQEIEVKYDTKTETLRSSATKLISNALQSKLSEENPNETDHQNTKCIEIERFIFKRYNCRPNVFYKQMIRKVCLSLKNDEALRNKVISNSMEIDKLCEP